MLFCALVMVASLTERAWSVAHSGKKIMPTMFRSTQPQSVKLQMVVSQKQEGGKDCGPFLMANITALAFHLDPTSITFDQSTMRQHLVQCMDKQTLMPVQ